jgi:hypothetical protein
VTGRAVVVPYITLYEGEIDGGDGPATIGRAADGTVMLTGSGPFGFHDGLIWDRPRNDPGAGEPLFGQVHTTRARVATEQTLCSVCGHTARRPDGAVPFLLEPNDDPAQVQLPPCCDRCIAISIAGCPHLLSIGWTVWTARETRPSGWLVDFDDAQGVYVPEARRDLAARGIVRRLVVELRDPAAEQPR